MLIKLQTKNFPSAAQMQHPVKRLIQLKLNIFTSTHAPFDPTWCEPMPLMAVVPACFDVNNPITTVTRAGVMKIFGAAN